MATRQELDARVIELEQQLADARKAAEIERIKEKQAIVSQINELILAHHITADELKFAKYSRDREVKNKSKGSSGIPKYQNPETGLTWTGHGKPPAWIPKAKPERERFLIEK